MFFELRMLTLVVIALLFVIIIFFLRKQRLELKYCLVWLAAMLGIAVVCIFPAILYKLSSIFGIETPINMLYLICIVFLACICISLTIFVSNLSNKLRELVQNIAMMEYGDTAHVAEKSEEDEAPDA